MNNEAPLESFPKSHDTQDAAAPELLSGSSETMAVRGMSRAVEQTRQLLPPINHKTE